MRKFVKRILYLLLSIFPKSKYKIVLESHPDMTDNAKAIYEYLRANRKNYHFIWAVDNPKALQKLQLPNTSFVNINKPTSLRYLYHIITSKTIIYGNREIRWVDLHRQDVINVTHGLPFKKCKGILPADHTFNHLLCTSEAAVPIMADEFISTKDKCFVCGMPRNDSLFDKNSEIEALIKGYSKFILWLPTYHKHKSANSLNVGLSENRSIPLFDNSELQALNHDLTDQNILLLLKFHPAQDLSDLSVHDFNHILFWTQSDLDSYGFSLYHLLAYADALITDYSSVFCDFLLKDKPIGFVRENMDEYFKNHAFIFDNYEEMTPGDKITSREEFVQFIQDVACEKDAYKKARQQIKAFYHRYQNGDSTKYFSEYFDL